MDSDRTEAATQNGCLKCAHSELPYGLGYYLECQSRRVVARCAAALSDIAILSANLFTQAIKDYMDKTLPQGNRFLIENDAFQEGFIPASQLTLAFETVLARWLLIEQIDSNTAHRG